MKLKFPLGLIQKHLNEHSISCLYIQLVIEFTAKWCGPCKSLEPELEELAAKYTDAEFVKIDVDEVMVITNQSLLISFILFLKV